MEALQSGLRARLDQMKERLARFEERGSEKRQLALEAMLEAGLSKLEQPDFTASARVGIPSLVVVFETLIPRLTGLCGPAGARSCGKALAVAKGEVSHRERRMNWRC